MLAEIHNCPECQGEHMIEIDVAGDGSQWAICPRNLHRFQVLPVIGTPVAGPTGTGRTEGFKPTASYHRLPPSEAQYWGD